MRVLITKLKVTHQAESSLYMKAVRATLILVPLLGIQYVLLPYKPEGRVSSEIYDYIMHILMHYQVRRRPVSGSLSCVNLCFIDYVVTERLFPDFSEILKRKQKNRFNKNHNRALGFAQTIFLSH